MKRHGNADYIFKGFDWTEIAEYFGVDAGDEKSSEEIEKKFSDISKEIHGDCFDAHPDVRSLRVFVLMCYKADDTYKKPLIHGLLKIKEDGTFLKFMTLLYKEMWN